MDSTPPLLAPPPARALLLMRHTPALGRRRPVVAQLSQACIPASPAAAQACTSQPDSGLDVQPSPLDRHLDCLHSPFPTAFLLLHGGKDALPPGFHVHLPLLSVLDRDGGHGPLGVIHHRPLRRKRPPPLHLRARGCRVLLLQLRLCRFGRAGGPLRLPHLLLRRRPSAHQDQAQGTGAEPRAGRAQDGGRNGPPGSCPPCAGSAATWKTAGVTTTAPAPPRSCGCPPSPGPPA